MKKCMYFHVINPNWLVGSLVQLRVQIPNPHFLVLLRSIWHSWRHVKHFRDHC